MKSEYSITQFRSFFEAFLSGKKIEVENEVIKIGDQISLKIEQGKIKDFDYDIR